MAKNYNFNQDIVNFLNENNYTTGEKSTTEGVGKPVSAIISSIDDSNVNIDFNSKKGINSIFREAGASKIDCHNNAELNEIFGDPKYMISFEETGGISTGDLLSVYDYNGTDVCILNSGRNIYLMGESDDLSDFIDSVKETLPIEEQEEVESEKEVEAETTNYESESENENETKNESEDEETVSTVQTDDKADKPDDIFEGNQNKYKADYFKNVDAATIYSSTGIGQDISDEDLTNLKEGMANSGWSDAMSESELEDKGEPTFGFTFEGVDEDGNLSKSAANVYEDGTIAFKEYGSDSVYIIDEPSSELQDVIGTMEESAGITLDDENVEEEVEVADDSQEIDEDEVESSEEDIETSESTNAQTSTNETQVAGASGAEVGGLFDDDVEVDEDESEDIEADVSDTEQTQAQTSDENTGLFDGDANVDENEDSNIDEQDVVNGIVSDVSDEDENVVNTDISDDANVDDMTTEEQLAYYKGYSEALEEKNDALEKENEELKEQLSEYQSEDAVATITDYEDVPDNNRQLKEGLQLDENGKPYYEVKKGDTLSDITYNYGMGGYSNGPWKEVAAQSGIEDGNMIYPGDKIYFPDEYTDYLYEDGDIATKEQVGENIEDTYDEYGYVDADNENENDFTDEEKEMYGNAGADDEIEDSSNTEDEAKATLLSNTRSHEDTVSMATDVQDEVASQNNVTKEQQEILK